MLPLLEIRYAQTAEQYEIIGPNDARVLPLELEQLKHGTQLPNWTLTREIETTFRYSPAQFLATVDPCYCRPINPERIVEDINYKRIDPHDPDTHYKLRIRKDALLPSPEIYFKQKVKVGGIKIALEWVRREPVDDLERLDDSLGEYGWTREQPDRRKRRLSFRLQYGEYEGKIALSIYDIWSTRYLTQMPWEADLEAEPLHMKALLRLLRVRPERMSSASFARREAQVINRRLTDSSSSSGKIVEVLLDSR